MQESIRAQVSTIVPSPKISGTVLDFTTIRAMRDKDFDGDDFIYLIKLELKKQIHNLPTLQEFSSRLLISPRTMTRRLHKSGACYRELVRETRSEVAIELVGNSQLSITAICNQLGYQDLSNFTKAFKQWTGLTPRSFRKQSLSNTH